MRIASLRMRLSLLLTGVLIVIWIVASGVAYRETRDKVTEVFDTQQSLLARQLLDTGIEHLLDRSSSTFTAGQPPSIKQLLHDEDDAEEGEVEDDAMGFAIFDAKGNRIFSDGKSGNHYRFESGRTGFVTQRLGRDHHIWRVVFLPNVDRSLFVAVGQDVRYRREAVREIVMNQATPWLVALPILLLSVWMAIGHMLSPLNRVARNLAARPADDATPLDPRKVPSEARPLIDSLNALFRRVTDTLTRERQFTADAAHELRSPLAALRVQAEVAQIARDPAVRTQALANLNEGVDRASHLVDQLLALSRLDPMHSVADAQPVDWRKIVQTGIEETRLLAAEHDVTVSFDDIGTPPGLSGDEFLLGLMLRNLLDNAVRYTPPGGHVRLVMDASGLSVEDDGPGVPTEFIDRIRERFYRPPGQEESGSGLGLSIVDRIATLHGMRLELRNRTPHGLCAMVTVM